MTHKRIKILYTIPNFNTAGSGKSVYDLVMGLDRTIFEPEVCCFHNKGAFYKEVEALGVKIHIFPFTTDYKPRITFLARVLKISNFFKSNNYDLIHSWHWSSDISEPLAAKLSGIPYVYTKKAMGWESKFWKWRSYLSSKIIAVNQDMVTAYFSMMKNKVVQFPLAIDVQRYQPMEPSVSLKNELNIADDDFVIITVANLVRVKGVETLIEAIINLKNPKIKLLIVGDDSGDYPRELKQRYSAMDHIQFIGKQLDVRPYIGISNLFVIPTKDEGRREGIPNAPLEAMSMERMVLGSNISGIRDILNVFPDYMFQADNVLELEQKINWVMGLSEIEKKEVGKQMRQRVINVFSIEDFICRHQMLYREMVN
ncbi:glycosyltransferase [Mesoflavibacter zeaxanthinifaciens]|uniref:glycosyltransferase n=1 Tax=Mesoflavibacter zeaxanthinifaciens TaxID=393060 RepID=UPI003A8D216B